MGSVKGHLLNVPAAAQQLGVAETTIRDWFLKRKHLEFVKCGRALRITQESIDRFIAANTIPPLLRQ